MKRSLNGIGLGFLLSGLLFVPAVADAQILVAGEGPVGYGHHHLNTTNMAPQKKFAAALGALAVCVLAVLARVNVYEQLMFHAVDRPAFAGAREAKLDPDDKLIVVKIGGIARGYPVRMMGYHHLVNDEVGGRAIVATY
jgi:Protein of unknown function (DUF3179)